MRRRMIDNKIEELSQYKYSSIKELLESCNIKLAKHSLSNLIGIQAISIGNTIFLNEELDPMQERFIVLHELGHIFFHERTANCFTPTMYQSKEEREANYFAIKMLMQREEVNLEEVAYLGVPIQELIRLREVGML